MTIPVPARRYDPAARDRALRRIRRTTGWIAASAVAGTGALIGLAAVDSPVHHPTATSGASSGNGDIGVGSSRLPGTGSAASTTAGSAAGGGASASSPAVVTPGTGPSQATTGQS